MVLIEGDSVYLDHLYTPVGREAEKLRLRHIRSSYLDRVLVPRLLDAEFAQVCHRAFDDVVCAEEQRRPLGQRPRVE